MEKLYLIVIMCFGISFQIFAQNHQWQWAETGIQPNNPTSHAWTRANATDALGNVYVTGYFYSDSISFGAYTLHNTDPSGNSGGMYTVKYDPAGNVLWAQTAEGEEYNFPLAICSDKTGNVYIAGNYSSDSISFGSQTIYKYNGDTTTDIFIAKYSSTGAFLWAQSLGGDYYDGAQGLASDSAGNVYLAGYYQSDSIAIGSSELVNPTGTADHVAVLIKMDSTGRVIWSANSICTTGGVVAYCVCTDPMGNIIMAGRVGGSNAGFGGQYIQNNWPGYQDIFVVKYNSAGTALWAQDAGGSLDDEAQGIASDAAGNIYVTGYFNSPAVSFGTYTVNNDTSDGSGDVFLAKYDPSGNIKWARGTGGNQTDVGNAVCADSFGNTYITGYYLSPAIIFGGDTLINSDNSGQTDDIFLAGFDASGNSLSALSIGGLSYDVGSGVAIDRTENIYLAGLFRSDDIIFGTTTLTNCTSNHSYNPFVAKYESINTGINQVGQPISLYLYPNPANDRIVVVSAAFTSSDARAAVYDLAGNVMSAGQTISDGKIIFNTADLAAGMYLIRFTAGGKETNARFVKIPEGQ